MRVLNGRTGNDANDKCRYICSNGSSVIDCMLASQNLIEFIQSFDVHDPNILIVHCCVSFVIEFPLSNNILPDERSDSFDNVNGKYLWNAELFKDYKNKLSY